jgi:Tol biopolymer transport system component
MKKYVFILMIAGVLVAFDKKATYTQYEIAFANFGWLNTDIFIADGDGNNAHLLCPSPGLDYNASFSADGNWVIFTSDRNGSSDIWRVHPDGKGLEQLTNDPAFDDQAVFSPDGKKIAFVSSREKQADIYIMDLATRKTTNLTHHPAGDFRPAWSPDGKSIAFSRGTDSKKPPPFFGLQHSTEVYTVGVDGSALTRRTFMNTYAGSPAWSPDGKKLVVYETALQQVQNMNTVMKTNATTQLSVIDLADNEKKSITKDSGEKIYPHWLKDNRIAYLTWVDGGQILFTDGTKGAHGDFDSPAWSPDGKKMVFHRELEHNRPPYYKLYSRDKQFRLVRSGVFPCYAPSGNHLICNDKTAGIHHNQIMEMDLEGKNRFILFGDSVKSALAPVWSPQGDRIAFGFGKYFQSLQGPAIGDIAIINKDGKGLTILTDGKGNYGFPSWSPDGKKLVYRAATDSVKGLFIIDLGSRRITPLTNNSQDNFPGWSPKGDLIAFTSKREGNYDLYTIHPDGSGLKRITFDPGNEAHSVWSPDGEWLAFSSGIQGFKDEAALHPYNPQPYGEICVIRADGTDMRVLTDNQFEEATPAWRIIKKEK